MRVRSPQHEHHSFVEFADAWDKSMPMAWQVRRSEFDEILFRHAEKSGARVHEGCKVRRIEFDADGADVGHGSTTARRVAGGRVS